MQQSALASVTVLPSIAVVLLLESEIIPGGQLLKGSVASVALASMSAHMAPGRYACSMI